MKKQREENPEFADIAQDLMTFAKYAKTLWYTDEDSLRQLMPNIINKLEIILRRLKELFPQPKREETRGDNIIGEHYSPYDR